MAKAKPKLYRVQFLITRPPVKNEKVKGLSLIHFCIAYNEQDIKNHVDKKLQEVRKENGNDSSIYLKSLKIEVQRMDSVYNLLTN